MEKYTLVKLTEGYAKEICGWRYDGDYSVYNFSDWDVVVRNGWGLSIKDIREKEFLAVLLNGELIAYIRMTKEKTRHLLESV